MAAGGYLATYEHLAALQFGIRYLADQRHLGAVCNLTIIAVAATPDDERDYGVEGSGKRSRNFLAARPRNLT